MQFVTKLLYSYVESLKRNKKKLQYTLEFCLLSFIIRGGVMKCLTSSAIPQIFQALKKWRHSCNRTGDHVVCNPLLGCQSKAISVSCSKHAHQWNWIGEHRERERRGREPSVLWEFMVSTWTVFKYPPSSSQNLKESLFPHSLFSQNCFQIGKRCMTLGGFLPFSGLMLDQLLQHWSTPKILNVRRYKPIQLNFQWSHVFLKAFIKYNYYAQ